MALLNSISFLGALITPSVVAPSAMWHVLILNVFGWIQDYGWSIVVFTVLLKLVLSPLDFYQRYKMQKNQRITERLKPTMEKMQKQYGDNKQAFQQKQMELNRKEGYSYFSSCLPSIVTMVVFMTLWLSMQTVAQYMTLKEYTTLYDAYTVTQEQTFNELKEKRKQADPTLADSYTFPDEKKVSVSFGQSVVQRLYYNGIDEAYMQELVNSDEFKQYELSPPDISEVKSTKKVQASFLWITNIWAPDVPWGNKAMLDWTTFNTSIGKYSGQDRNGLSNEQREACLTEVKYNEVMGKLLAGDARNKPNGYLILPILTVLLSLGSQFISTLQQKRAGQTNAKGGAATGMKVMMVIMPVMMALFAIQYASIFTLYMVTNSAVSLFFNFLFTSLIKLWDNHKRKKDYGIKVGSPRTINYNKSPIVHYVKGANPDAGKRPDEYALAGVSDGDVEVSATAITKKEKAKNKGKANAPQQIKRSGRPDPNELMNLDLSKRDKKNKK